MVKVTPGRFTPGTDAVPIIQDWSGRGRKISSLQGFYLWTLQLVSRYTDRAIPAGISRTRGKKFETSLESQIQKLPLLDFWKATFCVILY